MRAVVSLPFLLAGGLLLAAPSHAQGPDTFEHVRSAIHPFADLGPYLERHPLDAPAPDAGDLRQHAPSSLDSEAPDSLGDLSSRVQAGDQVSVRLIDGGDIVGTVETVSETSLIVTVNGQSRRLSANEIQGVVLRDGGNRVSRGLWIGAPLGAFFATVPCYRVDPPSGSNARACGTSVAAGAAVGGALGAFLGSRARHPVVIYAAPTTVPRATPASLAQPSLADALSARLQPFETIHVRRTSGDDLTGRFVRASETGLTLEVNDMVHELAADTVLQVRRDGGRKAKRGALVGAIAGGALGLAAIKSGGDSEFAVAGALTGAAGGALYGALIGAFFRDHPVVYPVPSSPDASRADMPRPGQLGQPARVDMQVREAPMPPLEQASAGAPNPR